MPRKIACLCPTYGRPKLVLNSLAMFYSQVYLPEYARLFILDDGNQFSEQSGQVFHLEVSERRYPSMVAKYDRLVELADDWGADAYAVWDDDDLYLPWHLSAANWAMEQGFGWSYPQWVWSEGSGKLEAEMTGGNLHGSIVIGKEMLQRAGGWPRTTRADFDLQMIGNLLRIDEPGRPDYQFAPSYVFRWQNSGARHYQNFCTGGPTDTTVYDRVLKTSDERIEGPVAPMWDAYTRWFWKNVLPKVEDLRCAMPPRKIRRPGTGLWGMVGEVASEGGRAVEDM